MPAPLGLVLTGGGARGAYQVGLLRFLARRLPGLRIPILTGVSAGAINAAMLASHTGAFSDAVRGLAERWCQLRPEFVFDTQARSLLPILFRWALRLVSGGSPVAPPARGLVDTTPLRRFLHECLGTEDGALPGIAANIAAGRLDAFAVTTTNYATGQSVTWCQGREVRCWTRPQRKAVFEPITADHVLASSALPLFFPAVQIGRDWHGDGGIRLTAPLAPALHLGAGRILAVSTRYRRSVEEADRPQTDGYPPPAQVLGVLMNAVFLDMVDADALTMERVNQLIEQVPPDERGDLRPVELLVMRPSRDLGQLARQAEPRLPRLFRFLTRGLGTRDTRSSDSLSMLMFDPDYLRALMDLGERDAEAREAELLEFLAPETLARVR